MASVSNLTLDIEVVNDGANLVANVTASYRINWSSYDQNSNQPYRESCVLIGDAPASRRPRTAPMTPSPTARCSRSCCSRRSRSSPAGWRRR